jgi:hypothetical protein
LVLLRALNWLTVCVLVLNWWRPYATYYSDKKNDEATNLLRVLNRSCGTTWYHKATNGGVCVHG